jgi:hypothetical protein
VVFFVGFGENYLGESGEAWGWLFVDAVPLLYAEKSVARQLKVEEWLDLYQLARELGVVSVKSSGVGYVV